MSVAQAAPVDKSGLTERVRLAIVITRHSGVAAGRPVPRPERATA